MSKHQGLLASVLLAVLLLAGCKDGVVDAPEAADGLQAKVEQALSETGHYVIPEAEFGTFGVELPPLDLRDEGIAKDVTCDFARRPFSAGTLVAASCADVDLISWQGGLYHLVQAAAANGVVFSSDAIPVPRESEVCAVTIRKEGNFIAENDCVSQPHSYNALNGYALLIPASDGPFHYTRNGQHTWRIGGQLYAADTSVDFRVVPIP